jgi:hypothetical protein
MTTSPKSYCGNLPTNVLARAAAITAAVAVGMCVAITSASATTKDKNACIDQCNSDKGAYGQCYAKAKTVSEKYACDPVYDNCRRACDKIKCDPKDQDAKVVESCASYDAIKKDLAQRAKASLKERLEKEAKEKAEKDKAKKK